MTTNLLSMPDDDESLFGDVAGLIERADSGAAPTLVISTLKSLRFGDFRVDCRL